MKEYVNGSVAWDKFVPPHWEVCRFRQMFSFGRGINITKADLQDEGLPCVTYGDIHSRFGFELKPEVHAVRCVDNEYASNNPGSLLHFGDFIFADTSEDEAGSGNFTYLNSEVPTIAGYHTVVARPRSPESSRFLAYVFDSVPFRAQISSSVYGIKVFSITQSILKNTRFPIPPLDEQTAIVDYLDRRTAEIDTLVADLQSQVEMLDRYKRELIAETVTKGLDKSAAMKDSGVDYIGMIPETWEATKNKWLFMKVKNIVGSDQENYPVLSLSIKGVIEKDREDNTGKIPAKYEDYYQIVEHGNLLLCLFDMDVTPCIIGYIPQNGIVSPAYSHYTPTNINAVSMKFYYWWFLYMQHSGLFISLSNNIRNSINADHFGALESPQPPIYEQERIAAYLDEKTAQVESLIADITAQIEKLKQYRQIVIHDAVTGKIKVTEG